MNTEELFSTELLEESSTEILEENSTEILEESITETETIVVDVSELVPYVEQIAADVRIILLIVILTFCQACMRAWRKNTIGMGDYDG